MANINQAANLNENLDDHLFKLLVSSVKDYGIFMADTNGMVKSWNKGAEYITGHTEQEIIGKSISVFYTQDEIFRGDPQHCLDEALDKGAYEIEGWRVRKDNSCFWANVVITTLYKDDKSVLGFGVVVKDLTEGEKLKNKLLESNNDLQKALENETGRVATNEGRYRKLIENSYDGITLMDKNMTVIYRGPSAERVTGWPVGKSGETEIKNLLHPEDKPGVVALFKKVVATPQSTDIATYRAKHMLGHYVWVECAFSNHLDDPGINAVIANFRDVSEKKAADFDLKRTIEDLVASKTLLQETETAAKIGSVDLNLETQTRTWSEGVDKILGYKHGEVEQNFQAFFDRIHTDDAPALRQKINAATQFLDGIDLEYRIVTPNGVVKYVHSHLVISRNGEGKAIRANGFMQDITGIKLSELKLKAADESIKTLINTIDEVFFSRDAKNGKLIQISPGCEKIYGYTADEFLSAQNLHERIVHPDDAYIQKDKYERLLNGEMTLAEYRIIHKDESIRWIESKIIPTFDSDSVLLRLDGVARDITQRKIGEQMVAEGLAKLEAAFETQAAILDALPPTIALLNLKGEIIAVNEAWKKFARLNNYEDPDYGVGYNYIDIAKNATGADAVSGATMAQGIKEVLSEQKKEFSLEYPCDSPVEKRWFQAIVAPLKGEDRKGAVVLHFNISDRKDSEIKLNELNENLKKQTKELAISNAELEQFAYVASHDLQEPLRMVTSFLAQLELKYNDLLDEKGRAYIFFAVDGAKRMRQIILDLLDFSRVGLMDDDKEEVDINKLVNEVKTLYRRQIEETSATVFCTDLPVINSYRTPLRQVFQNLLGNCLKYSKPSQPCCIEISCKETKSQYQFSIKDNGIGINSEYFDKIFIIFQRLHRKDEYGGTGMGLAITKKIIGRLGGKIWVESEEGVGSTFHFTLKKR